VKPTPVSVRPDTARPVIAWMPGAARPGPAGVAAFQVVPSGDVHTTTTCSPGRAASTVPSELPFIRPGVKPADVVTVAANVQAVPLPERYTLAARTPSTVAGPALGQGETAGNLAATET
jgi:hypothetical protein